MQGVREIEHVVVDGGSADGTIRMVEEYGGKVSYDVRLIGGPDLGVYDAMNKGVRETRGRYLYFLGAGDVVLRGAFGAVIGELPLDDCAIVYGDAILEGRRYDGVFDARKLRSKNICHQAVFYGRDVFGRVGEFDLSYPRFSDWEFNMRCFGDAGILKKYVPVVVAEFEAGGISSTGDAAFYRDRAALVRQHLGLWPYDLGWLSRRVVGMVGAGWKKIRRR